METNEFKVSGLYLAARIASAISALFSFYLICLLIVLKLKNTDDTVVTVISYCVYNTISMIMFQSYFADVNNQMTGGVRRFLDVCVAINIVFFLVCWLFWLSENKQDFSKKRVDLSLNYLIFLVFQSFFLVLLCAYRKTRNYLNQTELLTQTKVIPQPV